MKWEFSFLRRRVESLKMKTHSKSSRDVWPNTHYSISNEWIILTALCIVKYSLNEYCICMIFSCAQLAFVCPSKPDLDCNVSLVRSCRYDYPLSTSHRNGHWGAAKYIRTCGKVACFSRLPVAALIAIAHCAKFSILSLW